MNLLLTSIGRRVELLLALKDTANRLKINLKLHGSNITSTAPALAFCDKIHMTCRISDPDYIQQLLKICQENQIDLLIPTIDTDLLILAEHKETFEKIDTRVVISALAGVELGTERQIIQGLSVGANSVIGAGTVVHRDIPEHCVAVGVPAQVVKKQ